MSNFRARLTLNGRVDQIRLDKRGRSRYAARFVTVTVLDRVRKLNKLCRLLRKQGLTPNVRFDTDKQGECVAYVTVQ